MGDWVGQAFFKVGGLGMGGFIDGVGMGGWVDQRNGWDVYRNGKQYSNV